MLTSPLPTAYKLVKTEKPNLNQFLHYLEIPINLNHRDDGFIRVETSNKGLHPLEDHKLQRHPLAVMSVNQPLHRYTGDPIQKGSDVPDVITSRNRSGIVQIPRSQCNTQISAQKGCTSQRKPPLYINEDLSVDLELDENILKQLDAFSESRVSMAERNYLNNHSRSIISPYCQGDQSDSYASVRDENKSDVPLMMRREQIADHSISRRLASPLSTSPVVQVHASSEVLNQNAFLATLNASKSEIQKVNFLCGEACSQNIPPNPPDSKTSTPVVSNILMRSSSDPVVDTVALHTNIPMNAHINVSSDSSVSSVSIQVSDNTTPLKSGLDWSHSNVSPNSISNIHKQVSSPVINTPTMHASPLSSSSIVASQVSNCSLDMEPQYIRCLNKSQKEAVLSDTQKPLLILAGPGSGKVKQTLFHELWFFHYHHHQ